MLLGRAASMQTKGARRPYGTVAASALLPFRLSEHMVDSTCGSLSVTRTLMPTVAASRLWGSFLMTNMIAYFCLTVAFKLVFPSHR